MKKQSNTLFLCLLILALTCSHVSSQTCKPSGKVEGKKPPSGQCNKENDDICCIKGRFYDTYTCSPPVSNQTRAIMTLNSFGGYDGNKPSQCDNKYHPDNIPVVALSSGWFNHRSRCLRFIKIHGNGRSSKAMVVGECDSTMGCDADHGYLPPCGNNIVEASQAVWKELRVPLSQWGEIDVYWADA